MLAFNERLRRRLMIVGGWLTLFEKSHAPDAQNLARWHASCMTSDMGRIQSLQILRFFAALMVVHTHAVNIGKDAGLGVGVLGANQLGGVGATGVDIFFVLSGAIMYHAGRGSKPAEFLRRRIIRIAPIYYIWTLVFVVLSAPILGFAFAADRFLTAITFWPVWWDGLVTPSIVVGWSLCFEMLFYCGFAVVLWRPKALWALGALYFAMWAMREWTGWDVARFLGNPMVLEFLAGIAVMKWGRQIRAPDWFWMTLICIGAALLFAPRWPDVFYSLNSAWSGELALLRAILFGAPAVAIVCAALQLEHLAKGPIASLLGQLGDASYSLYVIHWVMFRLATPFVPSMSPDLIVLIAMPLAVLVSWAAYIWVEKPMLAVLRRRPSMATATA